MATLTNLAAVALLAASGLVHGRLTDRWGTSTELAEAVAQLDRVPRVVGDWESRDAEMDRRQIQVAEIQGYLARTYRNVRDGREVTMLLVCGRPGPIAVHTPDVCYEGAGYKAGSPPTPGSVTTGRGRHAKFFQARFVKVGALSPEALDIIWAWKGPGDWEAPASPRIRFAASRALYKVYLITRRGGDRGPTPNLPAVDEDFAGLILTAIDRALPGGPSVTSETALASGRPPAM